MKIAVYSTKHYDQKYLEQVNQQFGFELVFFDFYSLKAPPKPLWVAMPSVSL